MEFLIDIYGLRHNYTKLNLEDFASKLGLDSRTEYTRELFKKFGQMVRLLGEFDHNTLKKLSNRD
jgi:hypothetical protein